MTEDASVQGSREGETVVQAAGAEGPDAPEAVGGRLGRYVVLEEVGRGAMGRVLRAYDPKLQREVALKEVWAQKLGAAGRERVVLEARAMAQLSHPNVVAVFDVEEAPSGRVMLVMEYVAGTTLRGWLKAEPRAWTEIVERFVAAGRGLAAAHAAGVLHRDFKPANVVVSEDGRTVKVTDFGLAKGVGARSSDASLSMTALSEGLSLQPVLDRRALSGPHSVSGPMLDSGLTAAGQVLGTPRYMPPEQHYGEPLTPAADQYALCVALWEAICGKAPFTGFGLATAKSEGPPPWPSTAPGAVGSAIRRGLHPEPDQRWASVEALLDALLRATTRRRRMWRLGLAGAGLVVVGGGGALGVHAWAESRARRCSGSEAQLEAVWDDDRRGEVQVAFRSVDAPFARAAWTRTAETLDAYAADWATMHTEACEATSVRGEQSSAVLDLRMGCLRRARLELLSAVDVLADADADVIGKADDLVGGLRPLSRCADLDVLQADVEPPSEVEAEAVEEVRALLARASAQRKAGRYDEAAAAIADAKARIESLEYGPIETEVALQEGDVLERLGEYEASEAAGQQALTLAGQWRQWDLMQKAATNLLLVVGDRLARPDEALRYWEVARGLAVGDAPLEADTLSVHASVLRAQGKYREAEDEQRRVIAVLEEALGPDHLRVALARNRLANVLDHQANYEAAVVEHRRARVTLERVLGAEHPTVAASHNNLGKVLRQLEQYDEAEVELRRALELWERAFGPDNADVAMVRENIGILHAMRDRFDEAEAEFRRSLEIRLRVLGPEHPAVGDIVTSIGTLLINSGHYEAALVELKRGLEIRLKALGPDHPDLAVCWFNLGRAHRHLNNHAAAEAALRRATELWVKSLGPDHAHVAATRYLLASVLLTTGRSAEALEQAELVWVQRQEEGVAATERAASAFVLARALWDAKTDVASRDRARELAETSLKHYRVSDPEYAKTIEAWLAERGAAASPQDVSAP